jgi:hypothetical protein
MAGGDMTEKFGRFLTVVKVYAVEVAATAVFLVFIAVETVHAIQHLLGTLH